MWNGHMQMNGTGVAAFFAGLAKRFHHPHILAAGIKQSAVVPGRNGIDGDLIVGGHRTPGQARRSYQPRQKNRASKTHRLRPSSMEKMFSKSEA
jgi:hypothetical protein